MTILLSVLLAMSWAFNVNFYLNTVNTSDAVNCVYKSICKQAYERRPEPLIWRGLKVRPIHTDPGRGPETCETVK